MSSCDVAAAAAALVVVVVAFVAASVAFAVAVAVASSGASGPSGRPLTSTRSMSDDEWLQELCRQPATQAAPGRLAADDSDNEWLQELLTPPSESVQLTLVALHAHEAASAQEAPCARQATRAHVVPSPQDAPREAPLPREAQRTAHEAQRTAHEAQRNAHEVLSDIALSVGHLPVVDMPKQDSILWSHLCCDVDRAYIHALRRFFAWSELLGVMAFKIGIASDPQDRYENAEFGYQHESVWLCMDVVWKGPANQCRELEIRLIRSLQQLPGCYNQRPGGDGVAPHRDHTCFCYMVLAPAGLGRGLASANAARVQCGV